METPPLNLIPFCPYCGSREEQREIVDREHTVIVVEFQCHGHCEGRSYWVGIGDHEPLR